MNLSKHIEHKELISLVNTKDVTMNLSKHVEHKDISNKTILLTGGLGYIGSHIIVELLENDKDYNIVIIDNLANTSLNKLDKIESLIDYRKNENISFYQIDLLDINKVDKVFENNKIDIVIHLAGLKSVGESVCNPIYYYETNLLSTINLIKVMEKYNCKNLIFSSSATVYGNQNVPYKEDMNTGNGITNPYGKSKHMQEEFLKDLYTSNNDWNIIILRYFNPISQKCELLKETPNGIPNNLFPYLIKVYNEELPILNIFGNDYNTVDGTCVRDFIHVVDLAQGHISACNYIFQNSKCGLKIYNLGSGKGISVKELIDAFEKVNETKLNYTYCNRRNGDLAESYANVFLAEKELNWKTKKDIYDMVKLL
jgi:UDP-glucose 4-epimerase